MQKIESSRAMFLSPVDPDDDVPRPPSVAANNIFLPLLAPAFDIHFKRDNLVASRPEDVERDDDMGTDQLREQIRNVFNLELRPDETDADPVSIPVDFVVDRDTADASDLGAPVLRESDPQPDDACGSAEPWAQTRQSRLLAAWQPSKDMLRVTLLFSQHYQGTPIGHFQTILRGLCALEYAVERAACHTRNMEMEVNGEVLTIAMETRRASNLTEKPLARPDWQGAGLRKAGLAHCVTNHQAVAHLAIGLNAGKELRDDVLRVVLMLLEPRAVVLEGDDTNLLFSPDEILRMNHDLENLAPGASIALPARHSGRGNGMVATDAPVMFGRGSRRDTGRRNINLPVLPPELANFVAKRKAHTLCPGPDDSLRLALRTDSNGSSLRKSANPAIRTRIRVAAVCATLALALFVLASENQSGRTFDSQMVAAGFWAGQTAAWAVQGNQLR